MGLKGGKDRKDGVGLSKFFEKDCSVFNFGKTFFFLLGVLNVISIVNNRLIIINVAICNTVVNST